MKNCQSCDTPFTDHLGIEGTCKLHIDAKAQNKDLAAWLKNLHEFLDSSAFDFKPSEKDSSAFDWRTPFKEWCQKKRILNDDQYLPW